MIAKLLKEETLIVILAIAVLIFIYSSIGAEGELVDNEYRNVEEQTNQLEGVISKQEFDELVGQEEKILNPHNRTVFNYSSEVGKRE